MTAVRVPGVKGWVIAGHGPLAMPPSIASMTSRWAASDAATPGGILRTTLIVALHGAAFGLMLWSEVAVVPKLVFGLTWGLLNFFWLAVLARPGLAAARRALFGGRAISLLPSPRSNYPVRPAMLTTGARR